MRVLLAEKEDIVSRSIEMVLRRGGFNVHLAAYGDETIELAKFYNFDLVIVSTRLQEMSGFDAIRHLRRAKIETPIIAISKTDAVAERIEALHIGADDHVAYPCHSEELILRVHAIVRRAKGHAQSTITTGDLSIDLIAKTVSFASKSLHMTNKEYELLELLALRKGTTVSKEMILDNLYGNMDEPTAKIIDVFVCKLRKKLSLSAGGGHMIQTVWGIGYTLLDLPEETSIAVEEKIQLNPHGAKPQTDSMQPVH